MSRDLVFSILFFEHFLCKKWQIHYVYVFWWWIRMRLCWFLFRILWGVDKIYDVDDFYWKNEDVNDANYNDDEETFERLNHLSLLMYRKKLSERLSRLNNWKEKLRSVWHKVRNLTVRRWNLKLQYMQRCVTMCL